MDDLWGNAWGSPEDDARATTWTTSKKSQNDDLQEDDLATPSWSTGPGIQWDEPSATQSPLWSNGHHTAQDWSLDTPTGNSRPAEPPEDLPEDKNSTSEQPVEPESHSFSSPSPRAQCDDITAHSSSRELDGELSPSPTPSSPSPEPSPPSSPDAFGTFTIGVEHSDTAPFPTTGGSLGGQIDNDEWGSPWGSVSKDVDGESAQFASDEWESAKLRQLEMNRRVPPELLSQILLHLAVLTKDAWPEPQDVAEEDWQKQWHSGMDVDGLDSLLLRYIPVLTLPQLPPSGRSFTAKAMADTVKLSRNTTLARTSPMSTFLSAKGSTAWETSVKSRTEKSVDEVPLGWRILEKDPKDEKVGDRVKKPTGLLASLWSRKTPSLPSNPPDQEQTSDATAPENANPAQALEQRSVPVTVTTPQVSPQPSHAHASSQDEDAHVTPSGSAVSRFLKRFSRPRSSSPSPRNSLTLTGDDLEFLSDVRSDVRPKSTDLVDTFDGVMSRGVAESGILRGKLPPPLPPPPKVSAPPSARGTLNEHTLISPNDPHLNANPDLQNSPEDPTFSALTPLTPSRHGSPKSKSTPPNSFLSHPFPPDKTVPSLILPVSSSRPNSVMSSLPVTRPQLQSASGHTTQPFDISQDDDDFSDFRSSPAEPSLLPFSDFSPAHQGKVVSTQSSQRQFNSPFDDLVHLMSSPTTGPLNTSEGPDAPRPFSFVNPVPITAPSPPAPQESASTHRASPDHPTTPTHSRTQSQQPTSPPKVVPTSPKQKAITQGHQRTQSLLDLAATRRGRWPAPPSPLPELLQPPPPPPGKGQGEGLVNADYFGSTPTDDSFTLSPPPALPGKASLLSSLQASPSGKDMSPAPNVFDAIDVQPPTRSPPLKSPVSHTGLSTRRALSPPPLPTALMNKSPASSAPVPLLPPPGGFRLAAPPKASPAPVVPEASPLALLMNSDVGKNVSVPDVKATPAAPVKGTGGLSAQDLSFFEGL